jgi:glycosyltransferase involved in cell wall biosynthesis
VPGKVVFVNRFFHPDLSATSQMLSDLAVRLARAGLDVHVICSRQLYEDAGAKLPRSERVHGVTVSRVWTTTFGRSSLRGRALDYATFYVMATARLWTILRSGDVAIVKTDPPLLAVPAAVAVALRGAKLVNWLQDVFPEVASRLGVRLPAAVHTGLQALRDRTLAFAKANVVLGTRMRDYLSARDVEPDTLHIIENWSDGGAVLPKPTEQSDLRARLGLQEHFIAAYSGNLGRAHDIDTLLEAAHELRADPGFEFLIIGGGAKMLALEQHARASGLTSFHFLPYQPRDALADSLAAADVHLASLLPDLEGLIVPSKMYGILAAGRPAVFIGDPDGELARLIGQTQCGASVRCGDGRRLAQILRDLRRDRDERLQMGARARAVFEKRFTVDHAAEKWVQLLRGLGARERRVGAPAASAVTR